MKVRNHEESTVFLSLGEAVDVKLQSGTHITGKVAAQIISSHTMATAGDLCVVILSSRILGI
jgi:hypothetical protein